jgi:hypothetical protein
VRGTVFTTKHDAGTRIATVVTAKGAVAVDPKGRGATVLVKAGQAVDVTRAGAVPVPKSMVAARDTARRLVLKKVAKAETACKVSVPNATNVVSVAPAGASWKVTVRTSKGVSLWLVTRSKVAPTNALAKKIAAGCR